MSIVRWAFNGPVIPAGSQRWLPATDLVETPEDFILRADLPGLKLEDVSLEIENGVLTLAGERKLETEHTTGGYHRLERAFGSFSRRLTLPKGVDADAVTATFSDGVLEVRVPKPAAVQPKRIEIAVGEKPATIEA